MQKKYQVFVSSTYDDLKDERKEVTQALLESNCIPTGMELFPASSKKQWEVIKRVIDDCDYYLLILAGRYGSLGIDDDGNKTGYTEMEFNYAYKIGKPIIAFINKDINTIPLNKSETTQIGRKRLEKFQKKASNGRMVRFWTNKDNLKSAVLVSIPAFIEDTPTNGWIKAGETGDSKGMTHEEVSAYDNYTGKWKSTTEEGFVDVINLRYYEGSQILLGDITRIKPDNQTHRKWDLIGCVVGESIMMIYYSHSTNSAGCSLVRHYRDTTYKGYYLRYNYETKSIDKMRMVFEKIDSSSSDDNTSGIDLDDNIIVLNDESGAEVSFEFLDLIEYEGEEYVVLLPTNVDDDTEDEVVILRIEEGGNDEEEENFVSVDDEKTLQKVFDIFKEKFKDEFNFIA